MAKIKTLVCTDLCAAEGDFGLDLSLAPGEFAALREVPDCHESALLSAAATLRRPLRGEVACCGQRVHFGRRDQLLSLRCGIGYVGPGSVLVSDLTLLGNLLLGHTYLEREEEAASRVRDLALLLGLAPLLAAKPAALPFQLQRLAIYARELAKRPRLMVLDHPGLGLNEPAVRLVCRLLAEEKERGMAALLSAEPPFLALADRVLVVEPGKPATELTVAAGGAAAGGQG